MLTSLAVLPEGGLSKCSCGCGGQPRWGNDFINGHNIKLCSPTQYKRGMRYCKSCEKYYQTNSIYCPSQFCNNRLRLKPKRSKSRALMAAPYARY